MACSSDAKEKGSMYDEYIESKVNKEKIHSQETSFSKGRKRSLWYRVPKSRVILGKHRGNPTSLMRIATENSAKLNTSNIIHKDAIPFTSQQHLDRCEDASFRYVRASHQGCSTKPFVKFAYFQKFIGLINPKV